MFLLKSIRRRLVTGFSISFLLFCVVAAAACWGLLRHQSALSALDDTVHNSPDKSEMLQHVDLIMLPLTQAIISDDLNPEKVNLEDDAVVARIRLAVKFQIKLAKEAADEFWRRCDESRRDPRRRAMGFGGRHDVLFANMNPVRDLLTKLDKKADEINFPEYYTQADRFNNLSQLSLQVQGYIARIVNNVRVIPAYDKELHVVAPLKKEARQSKAFLKWVYIIIGIAMITFSVTLYCAFHWVSIPLRHISKGASRVANGDFGYRLPEVCCWKDEFHRLVTDFNRMADRFQESQEDLNSQVEERSKQLVRSERLAGVGILAAGMAHELNSPLQSIGMSAESIQMRLYDQLEPNDDEEVQEIFERLGMIQKESRRCGEITQKLLSFARDDNSAKSQSAIPETRREDVTRVISEVVTMIRPLKKYSGHDLIFDENRPLMIEINASRIKQVILNLVANALQATGDQGRVEVTVQDRTDWVVIRVADDGQGMTPDEKEHLFDPFFTTKEAGKGTGLGLSITHRIVEEHHGTIDPVSDGRGKGSTFVVKLPKRQPQQNAA